MNETDSVQSRLMALEEEYERKRREITQALEQELLAKIADKKQELAALEDEYAKLTGKQLKPTKTGIRRRRLTKEEQAAIQQKIIALLKTKPEGAKMRHILAVSDAPVLATRKILLSIPGIKSEGSRATMIYKLVA